MTKPKKPHTVVEKVVCPVCSCFVGLITNDGHGPIFEGCNARLIEHVDHPAVKLLLATDQPNKRVEAINLAERLQIMPNCPMYKKLAKYQPAMRPTHQGNGFSLPDSDGLGGYQDVARKCLED